MHARQRAVGVREHQHVVEQSAITFAHANLAVHEILFAPREAANGTGIVALFQVEAIRPVTLTFHFTPEMKRMWPASTEDNFPEWVKTGDGNGFYVLHQTLGQNAAAIGMPGTQPGIVRRPPKRPSVRPGANMRTPGVPLP